MKAKSELMPAQKREAAVEMARNFLAMGISSEKVTQGTGLPLAQVEQLRQEASVVEAKQLTWGARGLSQQAQLREVSSGLSPPTDKTRPGLRR